MPTPAETSLPNYANRILTSADILLNHALFEGVGIPDWWITNVKASGISTERREELRLNFPHVMLLRRVVLGLAWSFPSPTIGPSDAITDDSKRQALQDRIDELLKRPTWEGNKDFMSALPWWRAFLFVDGDIFFKFPQDVDGQKVLPERMPAENSRLMLSDERRKVISGFEFRYKVSSGLETDPDGSFEVVERYYAPTRKMDGEGNIRETPSSWVVVSSPEYPEGHKETYPEWPFVLVSHLAWEERFNHPRGLPLFERLKQKALHVYSVMVDRRSAGKFAGSKMFVRKNAQGTLPTVKHGAVIDVKDLDPTKKADFQGLDVSTDDTTLRNEYIDAYRELYAEAWLVAPMDEAANSVQPQSGKAMRLAAKDTLLYKSAYIVAEAQFIRDMLAKVLTIEGEEVKPSDLRCDYDLSIEPDPSERREDARFYEDSGFTQQALRAMGKDDEEIELLMQEREESREASMLSDKSALRAKADDEPAGDEEDPEADEDMEEDMDMDMDGKPKPKA